MNTSSQPLLKPTDSEYSIMALSCYNLVAASAGKICAILYVSLHVDTYNMAHILSAEAATKL